MFAREAYTAQVCVCFASKLLRDKCDIMKISFDIIPFWADGRVARLPSGATVL